MSTQDWINIAMDGSAVWNVGQIDKPTARALDKLVRNGVLVRSRLSWCNISQPKPVWHLPSVTP